jgi:anaerobic magnesium-protoporphyrin IX monomethyl ester cyclase
VNRRALWVYPSQPTAGYEITNRIDHRIIRKPPLGMLYLASVLKPLGWRSEVWDQTVRGFTDADLVAQVRATKPGFVGIYTDTELRGVVLDMVRALRAGAPEVPVFVGGPGTQVPGPYVEAGAAAAAIGEAENTIVELTQWLEGERPLAGVRGIARPGPEGVVMNPPQPLIGDLDALPFPDRSLLDVRDYYDLQIIGMRRPYITVMASRGCYFRCTFCSSPKIWGRKVRLRSPADVVAEIGEAVAQFGVKYVGFHDDIFGFDDAWSAEFCERMAAAPWEVRWACMAHPFTFKKRGREKLAAWRRAGADFIAFGLQTSEARSLKTIQRSRREPGELADVIATCKELGIFTKVEFIFGLPGDTREKLQGDIDYAMRVRPHTVKFYTLTLLEGSDLGEAHTSNAEVCDIPLEEVKALSARAMRRYYLSPGTLGQLARYAVRHNPAWFGFALRSLPFFLGATGLSRGGGAPG